MGIVSKFHRTSACKQCKLLSVWVQEVFRKCSWAVCTVSWWRWRWSIRTSLLKPANKLLLKIRGWYFRLVRGTLLSLNSTWLLKPRIMLFSLWNIAMVENCSISFVEWRRWKRQMQSSTSWKPFQHLNICTQKVFFIAIWNHKILLSMRKVMSDWQILDSLRQSTEGLLIVSVAVLSICLQKCYSSKY